MRAQRWVDSGTSVSSDSIECIGFVGIWRNVCCQSDLFSACVSNYPQSNTNGMPQWWAHRWLWLSSFYCNVFPLFFRFIHTNYTLYTHTGPVSLHFATVSLAKPIKPTKLTAFLCVHAFHPHFSFVVRFFSCDSIFFVGKYFSVSVVVVVVVFLRWSFLWVPDFSVGVAHSKGFIRVLVEQTERQR